MNLLDDGVNRYLCPIAFDPFVMSQSMSIAGISMRTLTAPSPRAQLRASKGRMLDKCANQNCSNTFRYLSDGKLYLIDGGWTVANRNRSVRRASESRPPKYAWLCSSCCRHLAIRFDQEVGVVLVPKSERLENKEFG